MARDNLPSHLAKEFGKKHYTKAELAEKERTEVITPEDEVRPSEFLPANLHEKFYWFVEQFEGLGILTNVDSEALSRYLVYTDYFWNLQEELSTMDTGDPDYVKTLNSMNKFSDRALGLEKELGLTMVSRMKIRKPDKEDDEDKPKTTSELLFGEALRVVK
ncbi:P27 family phage terminase small subunit [Ignavigranum ruoffiae]|uniref:P27 family phage terminase small subunit n=1 Tax=Ignavigranum ruoffiae TaxID=89093 RepID=UPI0023524231|nr:P27 family phage terminase small subunit [Ignavigranum ruoffiae]